MLSLIQIGVAGMSNAEERQKHQSTLILKQRLNSTDGKLAEIRVLNSSSTVKMVKFSDLIVMVMTHTLQKDKVSHLESK